METDDIRVTWDGTPDGERVMIFIELEDHDHSYSFNRDEATSLMGWINRWLTITGAEDQRAIDTQFNDIISNFGNPES